MAKKSSALEKLQSQRAATGRKIDASAILSKRSKPVSRTAGIETTPEEALAEEHAILSQFINPVAPTTDTGTESDPVSEKIPVSFLDSESEINTVFKKDPESDLDTVTDLDSALNSDPVSKTTATQSNISPFKRSNPKTDIKTTNAPLSEMIPDLLVQHGNQKVKITKGYTAVSWAVDDILAGVQTTSEQAVYRQLYRLAYGFGNTHCFVGNATLEKRCNLSKTPLKSALNSLKKKRHIEAVAVFNEKVLKGTIYRVFLPTEIKSIAKLIPKIKEKDTGLDLGPVSDLDPVSYSDAVSQDTGSDSDTVSESDPYMNENCNSLTSEIEKPDSHPVQTRYSVPKNTIWEPIGENQVSGNLALKYEQPLELDQPNENRLTPQEEDYIYSRPNKEQEEIFDAQDAWDQILGSKSRPAPAKLNFLLDQIRRLGYEYKSLDKWFRDCLEKTKQKQPDDPVAWMVSALKGGRYP